LQTATLQKCRHGMFGDATPVAVLGRRVEEDVSCVIWLATSTASVTSTEGLKRKFATPPVAPTVVPRRISLARSGHIHLSMFGREQPIRRVVVLMTKREGLRTVSLCARVRGGSRHRRSTDAPNAGAGPFRAHSSADDWRSPSRKSKRGRAIRPGRGGLAAVGGELHKARCYR
jgi:hypothetical protein